VVRRLGHTHRHAPNVAVRSASAPVAAVAAPQPSTTTVAYVAQQVPAPVVVRHAGKPARPGDRVHVVFAGESLWSIAQDVLGAKASVGETAREVDRLWALNRERIGTGDPDLLPIGTRLVLR
jgi:nucleoid-associated protein YgaU